MWLARITNLGIILLWHGIHVEHIVVIEFLVDTEECSNWSDFRKIKMQALDSACLRQSSQYHPLKNTVKPYISNPESSGWLEFWHQNLVMFYVRDASFVVLPWPSWTVHQVRWGYLWGDDGPEITGHLDKVCRLRNFASILTELKHKTQRPETGEIGNHKRVRATSLPSCLGSPHDIFTWQVGVL